MAVHLGFLLVRAWPPYSKWRGTLFAGLLGCAGVADDLRRTLAAAQWRERQDALSAALDGLAGLQRRAGLPATAPAVVPFYDRPFVHLRPGFVGELADTIGSGDVRALPSGVGSVEQQTDNVDVLTVPGRRRAFVNAVHASPTAPDPS